MQKTLLLVVVPFIAACGSLDRRASPSLPGGHDVVMTKASASAESEASSRSSGLLSSSDYLYASADESPALSFAPPQDEKKVGDSYTLLRVGAFDPTGDLSSLDTGFWGEVAFGRRFLKLVSVEGSIGYYQLDGGTGGFEVYGVPIKVDARLGVPLLIFEIYGGVGLGGVWAHTKANGVGSEDSFALFGNAFAGAEVGLGGVALGLEYRYIKSDDLDLPGGVGSFQLEGNALFVTASLPF